MPLGYKHTQGTKDKLRKLKLGKKLSSEHREKVIKTLGLYKEGKDNPNWKGGRVNSFSDKKTKSTRIKGTKGYVWIKLPDHPRAYAQGYYPEHRYVMEQKLGRILGKYEHVHHINHIKDDNRPENLELVSGQTHNLITRMETEIIRLEKENTELKNMLNKYIVEK